MRFNPFGKVALTLIAVLLGILALRPFVLPQATEAQSPQVYDFYVEPGIHMLRSPDGSRQVLGKVMVDMRTGNVWGFPTTVDAPYPVDVTKQEPPTSKPFYLGRFDFAAARRSM